MAFKRGKDNPVHKPKNKENGKQETTKSIEPLCRNRWK